MSEALMGVIVGALISALGTWITLDVQHRRWATEFRVKRLEGKRDKLETATTRILEELPEAMATRHYSSMMTSEIESLFPEKVSAAFSAMISDPDKSELNMKHHYYFIALAMRLSLSEIDNQIDAIVLGKKIRRLEH